jgi:hypothetical protein
MRPSKGAVSLPPHVGRNRVPLSGIGRVRNPKLLQKLRSSYDLGITKDQSSRWQKLAAWRDGRYLATRDGPRSQARSSSGARYGIISQGAVSGRLIPSKICIAICSSVSGLCSGCLRKSMICAATCSSVSGFFFRFLRKSTLNAMLSIQWTITAPICLRFQVRRTIPPTVGILPKLCAGAVTSITERRTEPLVRAAESGEPARGLWAPRLLFEGTVAAVTDKRNAETRQCSFWSPGSTRGGVQGGFLTTFHLSDRLRLCAISRQISRPTRPHRKARSAQL